MKERVLKRKWNTQGFTLIELMVVMAIIATLAAILLPAVSNYVQRAKHQKYIGDVNSIYSGVKMVQIDTGYYPEERGEMPNACSKGTSLYQNRFNDSTWNGPYVETWPKSTPWGGCYQLEGMNGSDYNIDGTMYECYAIIRIIDASIPGEAGQELDDTIDDGDSSTGFVQGGYKLYAWD